MEIVRRVYEAAARRDSDAVLALYHPEVEWVPGGDHPLGGMIGEARGSEGLRRWMREWHQMWEEYEDTLEELIAAEGEKVVSVSTMRGRGRGSGVSVESTSNAGVWTIRDGRIIRVEWFGTREQALEAAGLSE